MFTPLFLIDGPWRGKLSIAPAPAPEPHLEKSLRHWKRLGITGVFSLMELGERPGWETEEAACRKLDLKFFSLPIVDHSIPRAGEMATVCSRLIEVERELRGGERIVAHCFGGIGRSGMATIGLLTIGGVSLDEAVERVSSARGTLCPETQEQREWLRSFDRFRRLS